MALGVVMCVDDVATDNNVVGWFANGVDNGTGTNSQIALTAPVVCCEGTLHL